MSIGKICSILQDTAKSSPIKTMASSLAERGKTRYPGTGVYFLPFRNRNGRYRTGMDDLDPEISKDKNEIKRRKELREEMERFTGLDLSATSSYWNFSAGSSSGNSNHVNPVKLIDGENIFNLSDPFQRITFLWLKERPDIASSLQAYKLGKYPRDTMFYVYDEELENELAYNKKKEVNEAIRKLEQMAPDRRKKVARLMGLPARDDDKEMIVYNMLDTRIKEGEFKEGEFKGSSALMVFNNFADMETSMLYIRDLVQQAISLGIYRVRNGGKIYEGEVIVSDTRDEL